MDSRTQQHYLHLWHLLKSLEELFWDEEEKKKIKDWLKEVAATDSNLQPIDIEAPDFLDELVLKLQAIILARPELPPANLPPKEVFQRYEEYLKEINVAKKENQPPLIFFAERRPLALSDKIYWSLKKQQLVDTDGNPTLEGKDLKLVVDTEKEIGQLLTQNRAQIALKRQLVLSLDFDAPYSLFRREFLGDGEIPGIADQIAEEFINARAKGQDFKLERIPFLVNLYLEDSPQFKSLYPAHQERLQETASQTIASIIQRFRFPGIMDRVVITQEGEDFDLTVIPGGEPENKYSLYSTPSQQPKTIRQRIKRELNLPEAVAATEGMQKFIGHFSKDPLSAILHYPLYRAVSLAPQPIKNLYFGKTGWQETWNKVKLAYNVSISPDYQRQFLQDLLWRGAKAALKPFGIVGREGQWVPMAVIGWGGNKLVTGIGEGLANVASKIPLVGKFLSERFSRRLGKKRKRKENLGAAVAGLILDFVFGAIGVIPKAAWKLLNRLPIIQKFKGFLANQYFSLEARFGFLRTIRIGVGLGKSFLKGIFSLNTVAGGAWGYVLSGGNPWLTGLGGLGGALYQTWLNIAKNQSLLDLLEAPSGNVVDKIFKALGKPGVKLAQYGWLRIPLKGGFLSYLLWKLGAPTWAIPIPTVLDWLWQAKSWWGPKTINLLSKIPGVGRIINIFSSILSRFGIIGRFFGFLGQVIFNPGILIGYQLAVLFGASTLQAILAGLAGGFAFWGGITLFFGTTSPFMLTGWIGYFAGGWLAQLFGLTGLPALGLQIGTTGLSVYLTYLGVETIGAWVTSSVAAGLNAALAGTTAAAAGISASAVFAFAAAIILIVGVTIITIFTVASAFQVFQYERAFRRGLVNPRLPITKQFVNAEKNASGQVIALNYEITYSYQPSSLDPSGPLKNIQIEDRFEEIEKIGFVFANLLLENPAPSSFSPCNPFIGTGLTKSLVWRQAECPQLEIYPNETKTIEIHLVFREPWSDSATIFEIRNIGKKLCNTLAVTGITADGQELISSLPSICVNREGEPISTWDLAWPIDSEKITTCFNEKLDGYYHKAIDIGTGYMTPPERDILAIDDGEIIYAGGSDDNPRGYIVQIKHPNGWISEYAHLDQGSLPNLGPVKKGAKFALSNDSGTLTSGPHLHFEIFKCSLCDEAQKYSDDWLDPLCFYPVQWQKSDCPPPTQCKL